MQRPRVLAVLPMVMLLFAADAAAVSDSPDTVAVEAHSYLEVGFTPIVGTPASVLVGTAVKGLKNSDPEYLAQLGQGKTWACISRILDAIVQSIELANLTEEQITRDPFQYRHLLEHSGRSWFFWRRLARIVALAHEGSPASELLNPALTPLLVQMEGAFRPFLTTLSSDNR